jgi:integrase
MVTKKQLLDRFRNDIPSWRSKSTLYRYPNLVENFVDCVGVKERYNRADVLKFLNLLISEGKSKSYVRWVTYVLRRFFKSLDIEFPLSSDEFPPSPSEADIKAPVISRDALVQLIKAVKESGTSRMKAYLALSTTYGLRRGEMVKVEPSDIKDGRIVIHTLKGGSPRVHIIPEEINVYLSGYGFETIHEQTLIYLFPQMQELAGLAHNDREGFHSIRRRLVTDLLDARVPIHFVYSFMRWKMSPRLGTMGIYTRPDPGEVDRAVFKVHPYLGLWRQ